MDLRVKPMVSTNPLLADWDAPYGLPPFDAIRTEHFAPALRTAMQANRAELDAIAAQPEAPSFDNTLAAFDRCAPAAVAHRGGVLQPQRVADLARTAGGAARDGGAAGRALQRSVHARRAVPARGCAARAPRRADAQRRAARLLERTHLDFVRAGARLAPEAQARYAQVMERLAELTTTFAQNVLHDEASFQLVLRDEAELAGLPPFARDAARQAAVDRGLADAHVITLSRSLIVPFLTFSRASRSARAGLARLGRAWRACRRTRQPAGGARHPRVAQRAGASCMAMRVMPTSRSPTPWPAPAPPCTSCSTKSGRVRWRRWRASGRSCEAVRREQAGATDAGPIEAWDWRYWAEKVRQQRYALDDAEIKPYFPLPRMVQAAFDCAGRLFGLRFIARDDLPVYHPDVKAYEVRDAAGSVVAIFLQDNFARADQAQRRVDELAAPAKPQRARWRHGRAGGAEQQQLRQGRARRTDAAVDGRCAHAVP